MKSKVLKLIISIIISAVIFGLIFTFLSVIFHGETTLHTFAEGALCGALYGIFDPLIQKWLKKFENNVE